MINEALYPAIIVNGECAGRIGSATAPNKYGNVMFYPVEGAYPYRICKILSDIKYIND